MPESPHSATPRAIGILFASGILIVFAGLAGLGATAISVASDSGERASSQTDRHASRNHDRIHDKNGYADASGRIVNLRHLAWGDSTVGKAEGWIFPGPSGPAAGRPVDAAPLAEYDVDSR